MRIKYKSKEKPVHVIATNSRVFNQVRKEIDAAYINGDEIEYFILSVPEISECQRDMGKKGLEDLSFRMIPIVIEEGFVDQE